MRLKILDSGYTFGTKVLFALIQLASRRPVAFSAVASSSIMATVMTFCGGFASASRVTQASPAIVIV